ncbi:MAG: SixA phosphatase family protein [Bdellovibrionales bacterium]
MKTLLLLRHAQALNTEAGGTDKDRKLSPKGISDAQALGALMARQSLIPALVLCSGAVRTRQTWDGVSKGLGDLDADSIDYLDAFYNAAPGVLLSEIQNISSDIDTVLVIAHNPGIHALAAMLANDDNAPQMLTRLTASYMPATLSVLECDIASWAEIKPYENRLAALHETIDYNADQRPTRWM